MKRVALLFTAILVVTLLVTSAAFAATPQDIYDDYATDSQLNGTYTPDELQAYLNDATVHQYGDPNVLTPLDKLVVELLRGRQTFPFTGFQLLVALAVVVVLIGGGFALRRLARPKQQS